QADAQVRIAGAGLLPEINVSGDATRTRHGASSHSAIGTSYSGSLNAAYEFDFWGKSWSAAEAVSALVDASRFDRDTVRLTVTASVANTYFDLLATRDRIGIAKENLANAEELLKTIKQRFEQGIAMALDVVQQENAVATERAAIPPLE